MEILCIGMNHNTASVDLRERLAFSEAEIGASLRNLMALPSVREGLILSTCNRVEILVVTGDASRAAADVEGFVAEERRIEPGSFAGSLYRHKDVEAVEHLFRVASSLDSMVVGEPQILGQIKDAFRASKELKTAGTILHRLLNRSFSVAKRVRTETAIAEKSVSVSSAAVELAKKIFGNLAKKTVMLLGAGEMAELAARHLLDEGVSDIIVSNRTFEHALALAEQFTGTPVRFDEFRRYLVHTDILVCSAAAPHFLLKSEEIAEILRKRRFKPMFLIDISVPRNLEPAINQIENVYLYDIDDLKEVVGANVREREREAKRAERIVQDEVAHFRKWLSTQSVVPLIVDLREKAEAIRTIEIDKFLSSFKGMSPKERENLHAMTSSIVNKLLHGPISSLKASENGIDPVRDVSPEAVRRMFRLDEKDGA